MKYLIHPDQKAFIKGRLMGENVIEAQAVIQRAIKDRIKAAVFAIDYTKKAFDTVDRSAMWKILEKYGYGNNLIGMLKPYTKMPLAV